MRCQSLPNQSNICGQNHTTTVLVWHSFHQEQLQVMPPLNCICQEWLLLATDCNQDFFLVMLFTELNKVPKFYLWSHVFIPLWFLTSYVAEMTPTLSVIFIRNSPVMAAKMRMTGAGPTTHG